MAKLVDLRGKTAVVTGASSGIGRLLAVELAARGARVVVTARRASLLRDLADEIAAAGGQAFPVECDVESAAAVKSAAAEAERLAGPIDLLVNNAGYGHHRSFIDWEIDDIERMMRVNYFGSVYWTKAVLPSMIARQRGWLVFVASVAGKLAVPDESAYVASKFALVGLAESISYEVEDLGVHVMVVCPGAVDTPFFDEEALRRMPAVAKRTMIDPKEVVAGILRGLARGEREVTVPAFIRAGYLARAIAPGFLRRNTRRVTRR